LLKPELFIPNELAIAPKYSRKKSPNLVLREIPLDYNTSFQVWSPKDNAILLAEEANLLKSDRLRLAVICTKLIWLLGATCLEHEDYFAGNQKQFFDWDEVIDFVGKYQFKYNAIDVIFSGQTFRPLYQSFWQQPTHWIVEPPCWEIFFLQLNPDGEGFKAEVRDRYLSVIIWTGQPISKSLPSKSILQQSKR
jgi:hypothetical protein